MADHTISITIRERRRGWTQDNTQVIRPRFSRQPHRRRLRSTLDHFPLTGNNEYTDGQEQIRESTLSIITHVLQRGTIQGFLILGRTCKSCNATSAHSGQSDDVPVYKQNFRRKLEYFRSQEALKQLPGTCNITVRRDTIMEDAFQQIMTRSAAELKRKLQIKFEGEEGLDYGGVSRY